MDNYPIGSDTAKAPWNEPNKPAELKVQCNVTVTLERKVDVPTQEYQEFKDWDEDLGYQVGIDTSNVDWKKEYKENCVTLPDMLNELKTYVECDISMTGKNTSRGKYLQRLLEACQGWEEVETDVD